MFQLKKGVGDVGRGLHLVAQRRENAPGIGRGRQRINLDGRGENIQQEASERAAQLAVAGQQPVEFIVGGVESGQKLIDEIEIGVGEKIFTHAAPPAENW